MVDTAEVQDECLEWSEASLAQQPRQKASFGDAEDTEDSTAAATATPASAAPATAAAAAVFATTETETELSRVPSCVLRVAVTDSGAGLAPYNIIKLFAQYVQVS